MRILITPLSKKELFTTLKEKYKCNSISELSKEMNIPTKTLSGWIYNKKRYIPENIILTQSKKLEILDKKEEGWGRIKGGKKSYEKTIKLHGLKEIKRRQSLGGIKGAKTKLLREKDLFSLDLSNPTFLEFYGALLGDGWLSTPIGRNKWTIGLCGNLKLESKYVLYLSSNVNKLFNRKGFTIKNKERNTIEFIFRHRLLVELLTKDLKFPIGKKKNLIIHNKIHSLGFNKSKHVIRGIFDTDGTFYLQKNRKGIPSFPVIAIHMNQVKLIKQLGSILTENGFRVNYSDHDKMVRIQGKEQLKKWMEEIGSSNLKHINKIETFLKSHN